MYSRYVRTFVRHSIVIGIRIPVHRLFEAERGGGAGVGSNSEWLIRNDSFIVEIIST